MKSYKILLFLLVTALFSCDNDDEETDPCEGINPPSQVRSLVILDSLTGKSLVGNNRLYRPDTITVYNLFPPIRPSLNSDTLLEIYHGSEDLLGEHLLKLSFNEVDTLFLAIFPFEQECYTDYQLRRFYYNGRQPVFEDEVYQVFK